MRDELARSRSIHLANLGPPYFISYSLDDGETFGVTATLGGIVSSRLDSFRIPEVDVRVGDYKFDNSNYAGGLGGRFDSSRFPLENDYGVLRRNLWLSTDAAYKAAVEAIARKRAALQNLAMSDQLEDFARAEPVQHLLPASRVKVDEARWQALSRSLSSVFGSFPKIKDSSVEVNVSQATHYQLNTEGTELRYPNLLAFVRIRATAQAEDGMSVHDAVMFHSHDVNRMPPEPEMRRAAQALAENLTRLAEAPIGDTYNGPMLFEGAAAAQLLAELLGKNLTLPRRPVTERGRSGFFQPSELEGRQGSRIMPEFMSVVDDATQTEWRGKPLFGTYEVDREGVVPKPLTLVEKGVLKNFLLTRQPVRGFPASNGHATLPGSFGANLAGISNLFVKAADKTTAADLKKKLMEMCQNRGKPYGIIVRKMDFPSSSSFQELRQLMSRGGQSGSVPRVSLPILAYQVYPDGREELIRGVRFGGLNVRSLKDITAAGDDDTTFEYLDNAAPFALMGAGGYSSEACVVAPSILIDDLELHKNDEELPKLPIVPAP
jgi:TldD protein